MKRLSISSPISMLLTGIAVIILLLAASDQGTSAVERPASQVALQQGSPYPDPAYPALETTTATTTVTVTDTLEDTTPTLDGTASVEENATIIPTFAVATSTPEPTAELATPTLEATPTPTGDLECMPGVPVTIEGEGPPHAGYLVYFNERAVSGGTVESDGTFRAPLTVGQERAGIYDVLVKVRGTDQVLRELTCTVPAMTPTAIESADSVP